MSNLVLHCLLAGTCVEVELVSWIYARFIRFSFVATAVHNNNNNNSCHPVQGVQEEEGRGGGIPRMCERLCECELYYLYALTPLPRQTVHKCVNWATMLLKWLPENETIGTTPPESLGSGRRSYLSRAITLRTAGATCWGDNTAKSDCWQWHSSARNSKHMSWEHQKRPISCVNHPNGGAGSTRAM